MDLKVIVATHKRYDIPKRNYLYPVFAGAALSKEDLPYQRDDEGETGSVHRDLQGEDAAILSWTAANVELGVRS